MKNMNDLKNEEIKRVKKIILTDAAVIFSTLRALKENGIKTDETTAKQAKFDELVLLLDLLYDVNQERVKDVIRRATTQGLGRIDYRLIQFEMGIE